MPRVTHVKKAQQRYEMIKTGDVVKINRKTKTGREVTVRPSVPDMDKPKPLHTCDHCGKQIEIGTPYKWIAPRSGPYGGSKRYRHESCPTWQVWEYSNSLSAQIMQAQHEAGLSLGDAQDQGDFEGVRDDFAAAIQDLVDQKNESADNIESGFGHETYQSQELREVADELLNWVSDIENWLTPDEPEPEGDDAEVTDDQMDDWRSEVVDSLQEIIDASPV